MRIIGFNLTKILAERQEEDGQDIRVDQNIDIKVLDRYEPSDAPSPSLSDGEKQKFLLEKYKKFGQGVNM